jgi:hypothetical protein
MTEKKRYIRIEVSAQEFKQWTDYAKNNMHIKTKTNLIRLAVENYMNYDPKKTQHSPTIDLQKIVEKTIQKQFGSMGLDQFNKTIEAMEKRVITAYTNGDRKIQTKAGMTRLAVKSKTLENILQDKELSEAQIIKRSEGKLNKEIIVDLLAHYRTMFTRNITNNKIKMVINNNGK